MPDLPPGTVTVNLTTPNRPTGNFGFGFYGPGDPLQPIMPGLPTRQFDYPVGVNTIYTPRHTEAFTFRHLRAFANVELVRMAIETRKDQLERLDWMVKPKDNKKARKADRDPRCAEVEKFLTRPNGVDYFAEFFRAVDEDLLAIDAPCVERVRTRGGRLHALEYVDGSTINLLVDETGRRPRGPDDVAFQQIVHGIILKDLTNKDLIYIPRNVRSGHIYGFSPVEQLVVTINTIIRRQASQLSYFTEGNTPAGIISAPDGWQIQQLKDIQQWFDESIGGIAGRQRSVAWVPFGSKYQAFKDAPLKDDFDEWLARKVQFAFSLPATPYIRQMNRSTAGEDQERALEEGLEPLKQWRKRVIDRLIEEEFGYSDLEFAFKVEREVDPKIQSEVDDLAIKCGLVSLDEIRDQRGQDPLPDGLGSAYRVYLSNGIVPLAVADATAEQSLADPTVEPAAPLQPGDDPQAQAAPDEPPIKPTQDKKKVLSKAANPLPSHALALSVDRPKAIAVASALESQIAPILATCGSSVAKEVAATLDKAERDPNTEGKRIADAVDLAALLELEDALVQELEEIALDAIEAATASIGVTDATALVNRVNPRAVAYAKDRAAELVSVGGDESLIASTRNMLRTIIADGLANNIGRAAIAENIRNAAAFSEARATLIANNEVMLANAAAKKETWDAVAADGAQMVKSWFTSEDEGVCSICNANEDEGEIAYSEAFKSGDQMEPGHVGCRCVCTARVVDTTA